MTTAAAASPASRSPRAGSIERQACSPAAMASSRRPARSSAHAAALWNQPPIGWSMSTSAASLMASAGSKWTAVAMHAASALLRRGAAEAASAGLRSAAIDARAAAYCPLPMLSMARTVCTIGSSAGMPPAVARSSSLAASSRWPCHACSWARCSASRGVAVAGSANAPSRMSAARSSRPPANAAWAATVAARARSPPGAEAVQRGAGDARRLDAGGRRDRGPWRAGSAPSPRADRPGGAGRARPGTRRSPIAAGSTSTTASPAATSRCAAATSWPPVPRRTCSPISVASCAWSASRCSVNAAAMRSCRRRRAAGSRSARTASRRMACVNR